MSKSKSSTTFGFEVVALCEHRFSIKEVGHDYVATFTGTLDALRMDLDLLGCVWLQMPKSERKLYANSIVLFMDSAFSCPTALAELRKSVGEVQFAMWDIVPLPDGSVLH